MTLKTSNLNNKTLTIKSSPKTPTFNLKVGDINYGVIKQHNVIKTTTHDTNIDLTFFVLTKETKISLKIVKDETITVKWNKIKGQFEITDNKTIIISEKSYLSKFSKIFYPSLFGFILVIVLILLLVFLF